MVDTSATVRRGHPIAFILLAIFSFIGAVIASTLAHSYDSNHNSPSSETTGSVRFSIFALWWTFLGSIIYLVLFLTGKGGAVTSIAGHGIFLFFTWLFTLAGAGAVSASINDDRNPYRSSRQAVAAFEWMSFILASFLLAAVIFLGVRRGGRGGLKEAL